MIGGSRPAMEDQMSVRRLPPLSLSRLQMRFERAPAPACMARKMPTTLAGAMSCSMAKAAMNGKVKPKEISRKIRAVTSIRQSRSRRIRRGPRASSMRMGSRRVCVW